MTILAHCIVGSVARGSFKSGIVLQRTFLNHGNSCASSRLLNRKFPLTASRRHLSFDSLTYAPRNLFRYVAESEISAYTRDLFLFIHESTALPWWTTIMGSAAVLKIVLMPVKIYQLKLLGRISDAMKEMGEVAMKIYEQNRIKGEFYYWTQGRKSAEYKQTFSKECRSIFQKHKCEPGKLLIALYHEIPIWIIMSITWRTMAYGFAEDISLSRQMVSEMKVQGPFWCPNLTDCDPNYITPVLITLFNLGVVELGVLRRAILKGKPDTFTRIVTYTCRTFAVLAGVISSVLPSTVSVFWLSGTCITSLREIVLASKKVRRALNLPYEPVSNSHVYHVLKDKYLLPLKKLLRRKKGVERVD